MTPEPATGSGPIDLLLVGAGHAHLHLVTHAADLVRAGYRVRLLAPRTFDYSGVAAATAAGENLPGFGQVDVGALAARGGVAHHEGVLVGIDLDAGVAVADDGTRIPFAVVSLNIGSSVAPTSMTVGEGVLRVKPLSSLAGLDARLRALTSENDGLGDGARVTVVGSGSSGLEVAARLSLRPDVAAVSLLEAGSEIGADLPPGARRRLARLLSARRVTSRTGCAVTHLDQRSARCADGRLFAHDLAVLATGLGAPDVVREVGLGDRGGVPVRATLQHRDHDHVYAAGDCALFLPGPLPRIGVHGVRQGPVLLASLLARAAGTPLPVYSPPRRALSVLDLGAGTGLAVRGRGWWLGRSALLLKRWIDRRWLRQYQVR